jgi:hypothetical protein
MSASRTQSPSGIYQKSLPFNQEIFSINGSAGTLNDDLLVRGVITEAIKQSGKSREQIAETMERLLGIPVTARMISSFTAESKELHRWPGAWDRAFCSATGDARLLTCRVELAGLHVITTAEMALLELGREYLRQKRASENVALLEGQLRGVEL